MKIKGKTALVAGGSRGIGLTIARTLAARGARLILPWHNDWPEDYHSMRKEFSNKQDGHILIKADLRNPDDVRKLAGNIGKKISCLHILINNIERGGMPVIHGSYDRKINKDQWNLELDTTLFAKKLLFENCLKLLCKANEAVIINISSIAALTGRSSPAGLLFSDGYAAASRGVSTLTTTWARSVAPKIRVNEIMLGLIDTRHGKQTKGWKALSKNEKKQLIDHTLARRTGRPGEVAKAVLFLIRDGDYMTGSTIRLDGGYILGGDQVPPMPEGII